MKRMLFGLSAAFLTVVLHAAPAGAANIIWATLAGEACGQTQYDLYLKVQDPEYFSRWVGYVSSDPEVHAFFASVGGDLYLTFIKATTIGFPC